MLARNSAILAVGLLALSLPALGNDWPQWRGPDRTDVSKETGLLKSWPEKGPRLLWTFKDAGIGYSGPAIVGDRLYSMGADDENEYVFALDVKNGEKIWSCEIGKRFKNPYGDGPRGTPTVDGDRLYALGGQGSLVCIDLKSGRKRWSLSMQKDLGGQMMSGWGYSESPLVDGDKLICTPGGSKGTLAALDKNTGKVTWRSEATHNAAYSSVVVAEIGGIHQYVQLTGDGVFGAAAKDGKTLWENPLGGCRTATIPTPIVQGDHVFVTSGYDNSKAGLLHLTATNGKFTAKEVYSGRTLVNKHGGVVLVNGVLYGNTQSEGPWVAMDFLTGKKLGWNGRNLLIGSITYADDRLYLYSENDGTAVLLEPNPKQWKEAGRFKIPQETQVKRGSGHIWTHPVVANGRLYLRDQDLIFCYDVRATN
jgi:outer membrane protein assembly factor BamB